MTFSQDKIWYADKEKANSTSKKSVCSDKGTLTVDSVTKTLKFKGNMLDIKIDNIKSVDYKHQKINWRTYLLVSGLFLAYGALKHQLLYTIIMLVPGILLGLLIGWYLVRWTVIEFEVDNKLTSAYFADGGSFGYSGIFGGNKKLFDKIKLAITAP